MVEFLIKVFLFRYCMQLFSFADRFRGLYDDAIPCAQQFYTSSGYSVSCGFIFMNQNIIIPFSSQFSILYFLYLFKLFYNVVQDELLWAAAWLHRATNDEYYLKYVIDNAVSLGGTGWAVKEFSWDNKYAGVQILLSKVNY